MAAIDTLHLHVVSQMFTNTFQLFCLKPTAILTYTDVIFELWLWYNVPGIEGTLFKIPQGVILEGLYIISLSV